MAVLILVDVQQAFDDPAWGARNNPQAEANIARLLAAWRAAAQPIIHVHHRSRSPEGLFYEGKPGTAVKPEAAPLPGEQLLLKNVNSCFIGTDLLERLHALAAREVVLAGITTDHCVSTTARMAANYGFITTVVSDATATFERVGPDGQRYSAQLMHDTALASLHGEFASVVTTAQVVLNRGQTPNW